MEMWGGMRTKVSDSQYIFVRDLRDITANFLSDTKETGKFQSIKEKFNSQKTYFSVLNFPINQGNAN